jgi:hypothetical protein
VRPIEQGLQGHERLGHLAPDALELDRREAARLVPVRRLLHDLVLRAVRVGSVLALHDIAGDPEQRGEDESYHCKHAVAVSGSNAAHPTIPKQTLH